MSNTKRKNICVLGSTGSIGVNTLDVVGRYPSQFNAFALTAYSNYQDLYLQCLKYDPHYAVIVDRQFEAQLAEMLKAANCKTEVLSGVESLKLVSGHEDVDVVMAAIVGAAGLEPNLAAARAGKRVLLANKESLVMSGELFMREVEASGAELLPIDSEHNAIFQCLPTSYRCGQPIGSEVRRVLLTASGGPFRSFSQEQLMQVTPEQACRHPKWDMGRKISVDSASLMNKGLELIEACWLFNVLPEQIDVHIHPESIIHSMVEYIDGSVISQMGNPDMRTPIAYGLAWPERVDSGVDSLDLFQLGRLNFERPDTQRFPCLDLARQAFNSGGTACALLNAANEVAVDAFLKGNIPFVAIPDIIRSVLDHVEIKPAHSVECVLEADRLARLSAEGLIRNL